MRRVRIAVALLAAVAALVVVSAAAADPTGSKSSFSFPATCAGTPVMFVVNNANGQGKGTQNQNTAPFAPAHALDSNTVFHPTQFDLNFTFTFDGQTDSFHDTNVMQNAKTPVTCSIDYTATDPSGATISLKGTVWGFFS